MTKAEIFDATAGSADGMPAIAASSSLATAAEVAGEVERWVAFGRWGVRPVDAAAPRVRTGRTQRTGETVKIAATTRMNSTAGATRTAA